MLAAILLAVSTVYAQFGGEVIPIRIAAGESVTLNRPFTILDDVFELSAKAGQTLALEVEREVLQEGDTGTDRDPRVFLASATHPKDLPTPVPFASCLRWMSVLPSTGVYHVVMPRRLGEPYSLRVSLLDPRDPMFDPGIAADRISIGGGLFPPGSTLTLKAFNPVDYMDYCNGSKLPMDGDLPARLCLEDEHAWLGIMSVEGVKKANPGWVMNGDLAELERLTPVAVPRAPLFLWGNNGAVLTHWGRRECFETKSWRGLRWLAEYSTERGALRNPLVYMFAAISGDNKYFIWLRADVDYVNGPPELFQLSDEQRAQLDDATTWETFQSKVKIALTNASPKSFKPDLDQLDAVVRSIDLR